MKTRTHFAPPLLSNGLYLCKSCGYHANTCTYVFPPIDRFKALNLQMRDNDPKHPPQIITPQDASFSSHLYL